MMEKVFPPCYRFYTCRRDFSRPFCSHRPNYNNCTQLRRIGHVDFPRVHWHWSYTWTHNHNLCIARLSHSHGLQSICPSLSGPQSPSLGRGGLFEDNILHDINIGKGFGCVFESCDSWATFGLDRIIGIWGRWILEIPSACFQHAFSRWFWFWNCIHTQCMSMSRPIVSPIRSLLEHQGLQQKG